MQTAIDEETTSEGFNPLGLLRLLAVPAIALTLMLTLTLGSAAGPGTPAPVTRAEPSRRYVDEAYTLYLYDGQSVLSSALDDAELVRKLRAGMPPPDWFARVETPAEEAEVLNAWH